MEHNNLRNFSRGHYGNYLKFGPVVQEMSLKENVYGRWKNDGGTLEED